MREKVKKAWKTLRYAKTQEERKVLKEIEMIVQKRKAKKILLYCPLPNEVNVFPLLYKLKKRLKVFVPYLKGDDCFAVEFRLPLKKGRFGIFEPLRANFYTRKLDLMVIPALCCDGRLGRIGYGKGYYDRFCAKMPNKPYIIFVSYLSAFVKKKVTEDFDICGDIALSPKCKVRRKRNAIYLDRSYNCFDFDT